MFHGRVCAQRVSQYRERVARSSCACALVNSSACALCVTRECYLCVVARVRLGDSPLYVAQAVEAGFQATPPRQRRVVQSLLNASIRREIACPVSVVYDLLARRVGLRGHST